MGLPPVVVGLAVYLALSRSGPLGSFGLLFTPRAMIIAQTVLVAPIIAALTRQTIEDLWIEYRDELTAMNLGPLGRVTALIWDARFSLVTALLAGFGRAAEVGAIIIVGGNIEGFTRTMTTARWLSGRPAARGRPRPRADRDRDRRQRAGLDRPPRRRTTGGMTMRAPSSELPIVFEGVTVTAGAVTILDNIALALAPGAPTVLIGPNGSGNPRCCAWRWGSAPSRGRITWGGLENVPPLKRAIVFSARRCSGAAPPPISASRCAPPAFRARNACAPHR